MRVKNKTYRLDITKEKFLNKLKDKYRLPNEDKMVHPFMSRNCEWFAGEIGSNSFSLCDYRFTKVGIVFNGMITESNNEIKISTNIILKKSLIIIQSIFFLWFLFLFFISDNTFARLSLLFLLIAGEILNYFIVTTYIKGFYRFFENIFKNENLVVIDE